MASVGRGGASDLAPSWPPPNHSSGPKAKATGMRKVNRRTKVILTVAAVAAVVVNAGVAWAYWRLTGSGTGIAKAGSAIELNVSGVSDDKKPLYPGGKSNLTVTIANDNSFPIKITTLSPGKGSTTADSEHRNAGCRTTGVVVSKDVHEVSWAVPKNTIGVFTLADAIEMSNASDTACQGATFTIPVQAAGTSSSDSDTAP
jgi:hypothetical protein